MIRERADRVEPSTSPRVLQWLIGFISVSFSGAWMTMSPLQLGSVQYCECACRAGAVGLQRRAAGQLPGWGLLNQGSGALT